MKRFIATIIALIAVFALSAGAIPEMGEVPFDPAYKLTVSCENTQYFVGETLKLKVSISDINATNGLIFVSFRLYFDSAKMTPVIQNDGSMNENFAAMLKTVPEGSDWECLGKLSDNYYELSAMTTANNGAKANGSIVFEIEFTPKSTATGSTDFYIPHTYCTGYEDSTVIMYTLYGEGSSITLDKGKSAVKLKDGVKAAVDGEYIIVKAQNLTGTQFKNYFTGDVTLKTATGNTASASKAICTGYTVLVDKTTYTVVVMGDINGDGKIAMIDYVKLKRAVQNLDKLTGAYEKAAHITGGSKIKLVDYVRLKRYVQNLDSLLPN